MSQPTELELAGPFAKNQSTLTINFRTNARALPYVILI
jgi:hypothetical protein